MDVVEINIGGNVREFPLGVSLLLYGPVGSGKTSFCINLTKEFISNKMPVVWICIDESPDAVREKLDYFNADRKHAEDAQLLKYIDCYTDQVTGKPMHDPSVINIPSVLSLNAINMALKKCLGEMGGQGLVVFDSLSSLLLYVNTSVAEEFMKVHTNRITTSKYTGIFILQENIHETKTEETFKMMMNGVLEFGLVEGRRSVGVNKLPLGSDSSWISSSIPQFQEQGGQLMQQPRPRKFLDSGGYLEGAPGQQGEYQDYPQQQRGGQPTSSGGYPQSRQGGDNQVMDSLSPQTLRTGNIKLESETIHLKLDLQRSINDMVDEQISLRDEVYNHDEKILRNNDRLESVRRQIDDVARESDEISGRKTSLESALTLKKREQEYMLKEMNSAQTEYQKNQANQMQIKSKIDAIQEKKRLLEEKIKGIVGESVSLQIPELENALENYTYEMDQAKQRIESFKQKKEMIDREIRQMEREQKNTEQDIGFKTQELRLMKDKKQKIESEIDMIKNMKTDTESKLGETIDRRKQAEEKLARLTRNSKGGV